MKEKYLIGKILKPRGLRGELKVQILTNITSVFDNLTSAYIGTNPRENQKYTVEKSSIQNEFAYISIKDVTTVERAENFREMQIYVDKTQLRIDDDQILIQDLIGFTIVDTKGKKIGVLKEVENYGGSDFLNCGDGIEIPYEDEFIVETNISDRKIIVKDFLVRMDS